MDVFEYAATFLCFQSMIIFQPFLSQKAAHRQTNSQRAVCVLAFPSFVNMLILHFASPFDIPFLQCGLQKYTFQVVSFRIKRTIRLSRLAKVLKLISLCNLHPRTKELCWRLLDSCLLATRAHHSVHCNPDLTFNVRQNLV